MVPTVVTALTAQGSDNEDQGWESVKKRNKKTQKAQKIQRGTVVHGVYQPSRDAASNRFSPLLQEVQGEVAGAESEMEMEMETGQPSDSQQGTQHHQETLKEKQKEKTKGKKQEGKQDKQDDSQEAPLGKRTKRSSNRLDFQTLADLPVQRLDEIFEETKQTIEVIKLKRTQLGDDPAIYRAAPPADLPASVQAECRGLREKQYFFENKRAIIMWERDMRAEQTSEEALHSSETLETLETPPGAEHKGGQTTVPMAVQEKEQVHEEQEMEVQTEGGLPQPIRAEEVWEVPREEEMPLSDDSVTRESPPNQEEFKLQREQHQYSPPFKLSDDTNQEGSGSSGPNLNLYNARPTAPTPKEMEGYLLKQQTLPISFDAEELHRLVEPFMEKEISDALTILQGLLEELTSCNDSIRNLDLSILTNTDPIEFDHLTGKRMWLLTLVEIKEQEAKQQQQIIDKLTTELINLNVNVESLVSLPEYISGCTLETPAQLSEPSEEHLLEEHPVSIQNLQDFQTSHSTYPADHLMMTPTTPQMYGGLPDTPVELSPELWPAKRPKHHDPKIPPTSNVSTIESARVTKPLQIPAYPECRNPGDQVQGDGSPQMEPDPSHPPRDQRMDGDTKKEEAPETENRGAAARTEIPMMTPEMRRAFSDNQGNPESQGSLQTSEDPGTTTKHIYSSVKRKGEGE
ncbi:UNVERIFIED_CONTAM: hypothetical protein K2H54_062985 [Gekko kuhli]